MLGPLPSQPFVSAFVLTYNHENYIAEAIESVLAQGWPADRFEFVLLDDGSTDATPDRIKPYAKHLTYIRQENQGINRAVTRLMGLLRGDVLAPCSGDDAWPAGRLELVVDRMQERPEVGLVYGDMEVIDGRSKRTAPSFMRERKQAPHEGQIAGKLLAGNFVSGGSMTIRGELKPVILPIPAVAAWEDWWFAWALTNVAPVAYIDEPIYRYRRHGANHVFGLTDPNALLDRFSQEIRFRRFMLGTVRPGTTSLADVLAGVDGITDRLATLRSHGRDVEALLAVTDAQRSAAERLAEDAAAVSERMPVVAAITACRAIAADPTSQSAREVLRAVGGKPTTLPVQPFDDVGTVTVFADAEELVANPSLVTAYTSAFGADDDVTLVAIARTWNEGQLAAALAPLAEHFAGPNSPDVLAAPFTPAAWVTALTAADCVLGLADLPIPGLARFTGATDLRAYVEARWRFPAMKA